MVTLTLKFIWILEYIHIFIFILAIWIWFYKNCFSSGSNWQLLGQDGNIGTKKEGCWGATSRSRGKTCHRFTRFCTYFIMVVFMQKVLNQVFIIRNQKEIFTMSFVRLLYTERVVSIKALPAVFIIYCHFTF